MEAACEEQKKTLETAIANDEDLLASSNVKLAAATEKESTAGEIARQTAKQNDQYNADLVTQMKKCSTNYITFETELCALKKIRGELYKLKGTLVSIYACVGASSLRAHMYDMCECALMSSCIYVHVPLRR